MATPDKLIIKVPQPIEVSIPAVVRLQPNAAYALADLQTRTGRAASELASMLITWAAERVIIDTGQGESK